jgi:hypothetical protein
MSDTAKVSNVDPVVIDDDRDDGNVSGSGRKRTAHRHNKTNRRRNVRMLSLSFIRTTTISNLKRFVQGKIVTPIRRLTIHILSKYTSKEWVSDHQYVVHILVGCQVVVLLYLVMYSILFMILIHIWIYQHSECYTRERSIQWTDISLCIRESYNH